LQKYEGLKFLEVGKMRLVTETKTFIFTFEMSSIHEHLEKFIPVIEYVKTNLTTDNDEWQSEVKVLEDKIANQQLIAKELTATNQDKLKRRRRSFMGFITNDDGKKIEEDLKNIRHFNHYVFIAHHDLRNTTYDFMNQVKTVNTELEIRRLLHKVGYNLQKSEMILDDLIAMMSTNKIQNRIIPFNKFKLELLNLTIDDNCMLPYDKIMDYYQQLECSHYTIDNNVYFKVSIPIVERTLRNLYKIVEIPAMSEDNKLLLTDIKWKYFATTSNNSLLFADLKLCYKAQNSTFLCEPQSSQIESFEDDCTSYAYKYRTINHALCKPQAVKFSNLTLVQVENGQYFYYTPVDQTVKFDCSNESSESVVRGGSTGIIRISSFCNANIGSFTLLKTERDSEVVVRVINVFYNSSDFNDLNAITVYGVYFQKSEKVFQSIMEHFQLATVIPPPENILFRAGFDYIYLLVFLLCALMMLCILAKFYTLCSCWKGQKEKLVVLEKV
jgi:hypothetical protein